MAGYVKKTLLNNERVIYTAQGHILNYFSSMFVILLGLILSGIFEPSIPHDFRGYEPVNEVAKNLDKKVSEFHDNMNAVGQRATEAYQHASKNIPKEVQRYTSFLYDIRMTYFGFVFLFLGFINFLKIYIQHQGNEYCVTNKRIIFKFGLLTTDTQEISLNRVEGTKVKQSIIDKIAGRGDVLINGVGTERVEMKRISDPTSLRTAIMEAIHKYGENKN